jgi:ParB family transcriptional regulator, chromosome partitioning protein
MTTKTKTAAAPPEPVTLQAFVPAELTVINYRSDTDDTISKEWVAMLTEHAKTGPLIQSYADPQAAYPCGNHTPVAVFTGPDGELQVLAGGGRRTEGCLRAGVHVLGYLAGPADDSQRVRRARLIDALTENTGRVPTTRSDEAKQIAALFEIPGTSDAYVARAAGYTKPEVAAYRAIAASELASRAGDRWEFLTLDQNAALAEFDGDQDAVTKLVQAAKGGDPQFQHTLNWLRESKEERDSRRVFTLEVEAAGYHIYGDRPHVPWTMLLDNLRTPEGEEIDPAAHAACDGAAVTIGYDWAWADGAEAAYRAAHDLDGDDEIDFNQDEDAARAAGFTPRWEITRHLCTSPDEAGHVNIKGTPGNTGPAGQRTAQQEADAAVHASEERRRVLRRNKEWRAAASTRQAHLRRILAAAKLPKPMTDPAARLIFTAIARGETEPAMSSYGHQTASEILGLTGADHTGYAAREVLTAAITAATPARAQVIALGMILGGAEHGCADVSTWRDADSYSSSYGYRHGPNRAQRHLAWLRDHAGYALSDIEAEVVAAGTAPAEVTAAEVETAPAGPVDTGAGVLTPEQIAAYPGDEEPYAAAEEALDAALGIDPAGLAVTGLPDDRADQDLGDDDDPEPEETNEAGAYLDEAAIDAAADEEAAGDLAADRD